MSLVLSLHRVPLRNKVLLEVSASVSVRTLKIRRPAVGTLIPLAVLASTLNYAHRDSV
jgi:hypothetical protein